MPIRTVGSSWSVQPQAESQSAVPGGSSSMGNKVPPSEEDKRDAVEGCVPSLILPLWDLAYKML